MDFASSPPPNNQAHPKWGGGSSPRGTTQSPPPSLCGRRLVTKTCWLFWDPTDCSPLGSSVQGIFQIRILEWVAISISRGSSQPRDGTWVPCIGTWVLYHCTTWKVLPFPSLFFLFWDVTSLCFFFLSISISWRWWSLISAEPASSSGNTGGSISS